MNPLKMAEKTRVLVIGGTGFLGKLIVEASLEAGYPTFVLVRSSTLSDPAKSMVIQSFRNLGIVLLQGNLYDHESLVHAIKQVDVVISAVHGKAIPDQVKIIQAIKQVGNIKRFIPSDYGTDVDCVKGAVEPVASFFETKARFRRAIESAGIPHTYISCYGFANYFLGTFGQDCNATSPPTDKVVIFGDGNVKGILNDERDIARYTIRAVDDPRTLNKVLLIRPGPNVISFNDLVALWEKKIGKTLDKTYIPADQLVQIIKESPYPKSFLLSLIHATFVEGVMTKCDTDPCLGVEATILYPEVKYTTVDEYLNRYI